jgi:hypothetical protein
MLSKILGALTFVRHAAAITLVTGAATAMVAGSLDVASSSTTNVTANATTTVATSQNTTDSDLEAAIKACLGTKDPQSLECHTAQDLSGVSNEEFWAKLAFSLSEQVARQSPSQPAATPQPEPTKKPETTEPTHPLVTGDLLYVVAACVDSHERSSAACQKALEMSGLSADEFYAKVAARFGKTTEPTTKPTEPTANRAEKTSTEGLTALIKDCLTKYENAKSTSDGSAAASEACKRAIAASGLSANDFWARFGPKTTKTEPTHRPEPTSQPTTKPAPSSPSGVQTVSDEQLAAMVKDCFAKYLSAKETHEGGTAAYQACTTAITASGLSGDAFWKKFGLPGATTN